jgi:hypothetical protein
MRTVQTFILRLFLDSERPGAILGALRAVLESEEWAFTDEQSLLALLQQASTGELKKTEPAEQAQERKRSI